MLSTKHLGNKLNPIKGITATLGFILCLSLSPLGKEIKLKAPLSPGLEGGNGCQGVCLFLQWAWQWVCLLCKTRLSHYKLPQERFLVYQEAVRIRVSSLMSARLVRKFTSNILGKIKLFLYFENWKKIAIKFYVCATLLATLSSIKMYAFKVTNARYNTSYLHLTTDKCLQTFEMILYFLLQYYILDLLNY